MTVESDLVGNQLKAGDESCTFELNLNIMLAQAYQRPVTNATHKFRHKEFINERS